MAQEDDNPRSRRGTSEGMSVDALPQKVQLECSKFLARLRRHQVPHALDIARKTLEIMRLVVATSGAKDLGGLIALIKQAGQILVSAQPHELVIGNMVRRVLYIVREETREQAMAPEGGAAQSSSATSSGRSLHRILEAPPDAPDYSELPAKNLKAPILEVLNEVCGRRLRPRQCQRLKPRRLHIACEHRWPNGLGCGGVRQNVVLASDEAGAGRCCCRRLQAGRRQARAAGERAVQWLAGGGVSPDGQAVEAGSCTPS